MRKWYEQSGKEGDVVISSRVRFARNLKSFPFPARLDTIRREKVITAVEEALVKAALPPEKSFTKISMAKLPHVHAVSLVERHLVSPEFITEPNGRTLFLTRDETISIMVNEEDHIRIQVMMAGLELDNCMKTAGQLESLLNESLDFAFHEQLGYLTQCPTNLGTGMRASLMLHLPALEEIGSIQRIFTILSKIGLGLTLRGSFGEGTKAVGSIYQLSNQITLGISEENAISNLQEAAIQMIAQERAARKQLLESVAFQDKIFRSYGILKYAKLMTGEEFTIYISNVRVGVAESLISDLTLDTINQLTAEAQPATMIATAGKELDPSQRDELRVQLISKHLNL